MVAAASERDHEPRVLDTLRFAIDLSGDVPDLQYRGRQLDDFDAVLPRIGASITFFGLAVVRQFEQMDVYTPTPSNGIANSRDKLRSIQILSRHDIAIPATTFVRDRADVLPAIDRVGGAPVVIKLLEGTQGIGVILAPSWYSQFSRNSCGGRRSFLSIHQVKRSVVLPLLAFCTLVAPVAIRRLFFVTSSMLRLWMITRQMTTLISSYRLRL